ncbi:hypothetical protein ACFQ3B_12880 [Stackebrandtia endophytica]|nr:hypothetical protein [Stackebrandtia endophytica]
MNWLVWLLVPAIPAAIAFAVWRSPPDSTPSGGLHTDDAGCFRGINIEESSGDRGDVGGGGV